MIRRISVLSAIGVNTELLLKMHKTLNYGITNLSESTSNLAFNH